MGPASECSSQCDVCCRTAEELRCRITVLQQKVRRFNLQPDEPAAPASEESASEDEAQQGGGLAPLEVAALSRELEDRNKQRDELLLTVKTLTEKSRAYKERLSREENGRRQQLKLLRKAQEQQIEEKNRLIRSLEQVAEEYEGRVGSLEARLRGETPTSPVENGDSSPLASLSGHVQRLQNEKAALSRQLTEATASQHSTHQNGVQQNGGSHEDGKENVSPGGTLNHSELQARLQETELERDALLREGDALRQRAEAASRRAQPDNSGDVKLLSEENTLLSRQLREARAESDRRADRYREDSVKEVSASRELLMARQEREAAEKRLAQAVETLRSQKERLAKTEPRAAQLEKQTEVLRSQLTSLSRQAESEMAKARQERDEALAAVQAEADNRAQALLRANTELCARLKRVLEDVRTLQKEHVQLKASAALFPETLALAVPAITAKVTAAVEGVNSETADLVRKYRKEMTLRKKLHNELVELKGNIRVLCRLRPLIKEDGTGPGATNVVTIDCNDDSLVTLAIKGKQQTFEADRVFNSSSTQEEVFDEVRGLVTSCVDGYNVCIFAYGQTGSGKTYTMEGLKSDPGINQRALQELFHETKERGRDWECTISVSVLEIYNDTIRDLLSSEGEATRLEAKKSPDGNGMYVPGVTEVTVHSLQDVNEVFAIGSECRSTASTNMNEHSSRSHCLLCIKVQSVNKTTGGRVQGKLSLVDLAGSERVSKSGADGTRLKETQAINRSLSCLGDVIHALRARQPHVPYRNSRLTYLLQDSLGGDSKTLMIVQVAPVEKNAPETLCSLTFAQRVRSVELGQASRRVDAATPTENGNSEETPPRPVRSNTPVRGTPRSATPSRRPTPRR